VSAAAAVSVAVFLYRSGGDVVKVPAVPKVLLAKPAKVQGKPTTRETLNGHLDDVFSVATSIVETIGPRLLDSLGLDTVYSDNLKEALYLAAYLHDLGKANDQFQRALIPANQLPQALRHEWISTWLPLRFDELDRWLFRMELN
jgi:CRISPR/Cas system-associated endonuclease Cas3-HD